MYLVRDHYVGIEDEDVRFVLDLYHGAMQPPKPHTSIQARRTGNPAMGDGSASGASISDDAAKAVKGVSHELSNYLEQAMHCLHGKVLEEKLDLVTNA